jgi:hypothetical protein
MPIPNFFGYGREAGTYPSQKFKCLDGFSFVEQFVPPKSKYFMFWHVPKIRDAVSYQYHILLCLPAPSRVDIILTSINWAYLIRRETTPPGKCLSRGNFLDDGGRKSEARVIPVVIENSVKKGWSIQTRETLEDASLSFSRKDSRVQCERTAVTRCQIE